MLVRIFIIIMITLFSMTNSNADQILLKKVLPSGEGMWYLENPPDHAINCPQQVKAALNKILTIYNSSTPILLEEMYAPGTIISGETQMFDKPSRYGSQTVADMIDARKDIKNKFDNYQYLQLRGNCTDAKDRVIYDGSDLEVFAGRNKRTVFGYSTYTYEFRKLDYKIISVYAKGNISFTRPSLDNNE